ncbi:MAG: serine protein kinase, partial [Acidobacteriota bacterium]|nr:serine protein kinase [Acidobacteriota bacterium]
MAVAENIIARAREALDLDSYRAQNWSGTFSDYLDMVRDDPRIARTAFERMYDMILAGGTREYVDNKKKITHYNFFDDATQDGGDAIYGLDIPLMKLVNIFKSAAQRYGTERRVILLHGPVGSSKSTIARLLKRGLERYSKGPDGAMYTFGWIRDLDSPDEVQACPMHE